MSACSLVRVQHQARADDVAPDAAFADQDAALLRLFEDGGRRLRGGLLGLAILHQLQRLHQPEAAGVADELVLFLELLEALAQMLADDGAVLHELFVLDDVDDRVGRGARDRVAAEGGEGDAGVFVGDFRRRDRQADRGAVAHALGAGEDVRRHLPVADAEHVIARAAPRGLHFVADEQPAVFSRDAGGFLEIAGRRDDEPAGADDRLGEERRDLAAGFGQDQLFDVLGALQPALGIRKG